MKISVWDTYVKREDGKLMHFDIPVPSELKNEAQIFEYGIAFLKNKPFKTGKLTPNECKFCHIEYASEELKNQINDKGFFIIEMEHCN